MRCSLHSGGSMSGCRTPQSPEGGETACFSLALVGKARTQLFFFPGTRPSKRALLPQRAAEGPAPGPAPNSLHVLKPSPSPFAGLVFPGEKQGLGSISSSHTSPRYGFQCSVVLHAQQDLLGTMANGQWWKFRHRAERFREKVLLPTCPFSQGA